MSNETGEGYKPPGTENWEAPETGQDAIDRGIENYKAKEAQEVLKNAKHLNERFNERDNLFPNMGSTARRIGSGEVYLGTPEYKNGFSEHFRYDPIWEGEDGASEQKGAFIQMEGLPDRNGITETRFITIKRDRIEVHLMKRDDLDRKVGYDIVRDIEPREVVMLNDTINRANEKIDRINSAKNQENLKNQKTPNN